MRDPWHAGGAERTLRALRAVLLGHLGVQNTPMTSLALVEEAVRIVRDHGAEPASLAEVRQALGAFAGSA